MNLQDIFESAAARWPEAIAVDIPPSARRSARQTLTYSELKARADTLAKGLTVRAESIVAILLPRDSSYLVAAQLAVLKAGAAHLCIEPSFPDEQIREILADSEATAVLTNGAGQRRLGLGIDVENPPLGETVTPDWVTPDSLAYLIYTSGTTGKPKGVMITHRGVVNLVQSDIGEFRLGPGDRVAQGSSAAYDSSVEETWLALASGATVVVMDDEAARLGPDLVPWLRSERISVLCPPPTLLRTTGCEDPAAELPDLRLLYVGGEPLTADVADVWGKARLVNGYGPTECTVTCLRCDIVSGEEITVGRPVPGMEAWILDEELRPLADGETGELCMSGAGLARGYHRSPELTATKFIEHPELGRIYRTGDAALRRPDGKIACFGRLDSQVKLRGYRIELEAIEVTMAQLPGVREAACHVQSRDGRQDLVAFVVPASSPPDFGEIWEALARTLPAYMVPVRFGVLSELPRSVGGKLRRAGLPFLEVFESHRVPAVAPRTEAETKVHAAFQQVFGVGDGVSVQADFFTDLGGSSLLAAKLVTLMRADPELARVAVRDVYEAPTIEGLARRVGPSEVEAPVTHHDQAAPHVWATLFQTLWILLELVLGSALAATLVGYLGADFSPSLLLIFALVLIAYPPLMVLAAVATKRLLIGRYVACREPVWGRFYVRNWVVQQAVRRIPWRLFEGTDLTCVVLRLLGARVGRGVYFARGTVPISGGWDLLEIGDGVSFARDAALRMVSLESRQIVVGPIRIGSNATLGVRSGVSAGASLGENSELTALSSLTSEAGNGEIWDGIPAKGSPRPSREFAGNREGPGVRGEGVPVIDALSTPSPMVPPSAHASFQGEPSPKFGWGPRKYAVALISARLLLFAFLAIPSLASLYLLWNCIEADGKVIPLTIALAMAATLFTLALEVAAMRLMGRVSEGEIPRRSWDFIRVTLKIGLLESAGRWLSGSLFWPHWLRLAGMRVGPDCEISTIMDVVPELVEFDGDCFLADGIYLGAPEVRQGRARLAKLRMSRNTFIGNHAVIPAGQTLPEDILIGVCTVGEPLMIAKGTSWFGLPPFELPRREIVEHDRSLTHRPGPLRYWNRVFWEALRIVVPVGPAVAMVGWYLAVCSLESRMSEPAYLMIGAPLVTAGIGLALCGAAVSLKWLLLGKVRPGVHALWSCWCSRWDFHYVLWGGWARPVLASLEGTLLLTPWLRALGTKIGRRVVLGSGFSQIVDPDMIEIGDGATVSAMFQAHTFEDRVLKIDNVVIEPGATLASATVPLYGAEIGAGAMVAAHGVVMKHERLLPGLRYEGAPTRQVRKELPG